MKIVLSVLFFSQVSLAAVKRTTFDSHILSTLNHSHEQAVQKVRRQGRRSLEQLRTIAFDQATPMKTRWKSFMVFTEVLGKESLPEIKKALLSKTWYMRSAGLTAMNSLDSHAARKWAYQKLGKDKALMVRMKALEILQNSMDTKVTELFWNKLYAKDSFHMNKSLWIREDLAKLLLKKPRKKDLAKWVKLLHGEDLKLQGIASQALAKLNKVDPLSKKVSYWQERFPQKVSH